MKRIRPIEIEKCLLCGQEHDKIYMDEVFTGRTRYICMKCKNRGNRQIDAKQIDWRKSARGKHIISLYRKNK